MILGDLRLILVMSPLLIFGDFWLIEIICFPLEKDYIEGHIDNSKTIATDVYLKVYMVFLFADKNFHKT